MELHCAPVAPGLTARTATGIESHHRFLHDVVEAPGHSPGCIALAVSTTEGLAVVTGDAIQTAQVAREGRNALVFWSQEQADASVRRLVEMADLVYPGHDQPFRITDDGSVQHLAEFRFGVLNVTPSTPGLSFTGTGPLVSAVFEPPAGWTPSPQRG